MKRYVPSLDDFMLSKLSGNNVIPAESLLKSVLLSRSLAGALSLTPWLSGC